MASFSLVRAGGFVEAVEQILPARDTDFSISIGHMVVDRSSCNDKRLLDALIAPTSREEEKHLAFARRKVIEGRKVIPPLRKHPLQLNDLLRLPAWSHLALTIWPSGG